MLVSFSRGGLYSNPTLCQYRVNDSKGMCTVCTLSSVVTPSLDGIGEIFIFFSFLNFFLPDLPIMKRMHNNNNNKINGHVCKIEDCLYYQCSICSKGIVYKGTFVQKPPVQRFKKWGHLLKIMEKKVKILWLWTFFQSTQNYILIKFKCLVFYNSGSGEGDMHPSI